MTIKLMTNHLKELYETDILAWYETTLEIVKNQQLNKLDLETLTEELENLVRNIKRSGESFLEQIIRHLLMIEYWQTEQSYNYRHWVGEIINFRNELEIDMTTNLKNHLRQKKEQVYQRAVRYVVGKTGLKDHIFPKECPYSLEQLIEPNWFPSQN